MRLIADMVAYTVEHVPRWNPVNICSYHLQEAGATPVQEIAFSMATACAVLDAVRRAGAGGAHAGAVFGRISFFVNAGVRFVEEHAKLRAMGVLWEELGRSRYGVTDEKALRFRYGVQVNSLGLTESQPENNVQRIVLEALAVTLGRTRPRAGGAAARVERGAGAPAAVGPAVGAADPAGAGLRDRPAGLPGHLRGLGRDGRARRRVAGGRASGDRAGRGARRRGRGRAVHEGGAGRVPPRADRADRVRRAGAGGREPVHGDRAFTDGGRGRRDPGRRRGRGGRGARGAGGVAVAARGRVGARWTSSGAWPRATRTSWRRRWPPPVRA